MVRTRPFGLFLGALVLVSCGGEKDIRTEGQCLPVTVLAASSFAPALRDPVATPCAAQWDVSAGSSTALAAQVREGAPADVFVSAGTKAIEQLTSDRRTVGDPVQLGSVRGTLLVTASRGASATLRGLPALVKDGWKVGVCVASAPCGMMADAVLANAAALWGRGYDRASLVATEASSAEDLVTKVTSGEIDAAIIYEYVCVPAPNAEMAATCVDIPDTFGGTVLNVRTPYIAVKLREGPAADSFMSAVTAESFRSYLATRMRIT